MNTRTELVVIGAGLAGLAAAVRASRDGIETVVVESAILGGEAMNALGTGQMPGLPTDWDLPAVAAALCEEAAEEGVTFVDGCVTGLARVKDGRVAVRGDESDVDAGAVIIASGLRPLPLGIEDEARFKGRGVSNCVACDSPICAGKEVVVIGGGTEAISSAIHLSTMCPKVTLVHSRASLDAPRRLLAQLRATSNIELMLASSVSAIYGDGHVEEVAIRRGDAGVENRVPVAGVFVAIGSRPASEPFAQFVDLTETGRIWVDESLRTSQRNVYAAGSVRMGAIQDAASAIGDGVSAARHVELSIRHADHSNDSA